MSSYDLAEIWVKCTDKFKESANEKIFDDLGSEGAWILDDEE